MVIAGDGQVSLGNTVLKGKAVKVRRLGDKGKIIGGFAGSTADALTLFERLEDKIARHPGQLRRACVEMAKDWRTNKYLRRLEAMMIVADREEILLLTGVGDVLAPDDDAMAIGSGGGYARAAALALLEYLDDPVEIAKRSLGIAADICIYTNDSFTFEILEKDNDNERTNP